MLEATDVDKQTLTYSGSSNYFTIQPTGEIVINDGLGLATYFDTYESMEVPVMVTDGIEWVFNNFVLSKYTNNKVPQSYIYVKDSAGIEYEPKNWGELKTVLEVIRDADRLVS